MARAVTPKEEEAEQIYRCGRNGITRPFYLCIKGVGGFFMVSDRGECQLPANLKFKISLLRPKSKFDLLKVLL